MTEKLSAIPPDTASSFLTLSDGLFVSAIQKLLQWPRKYRKKLQVALYKFGRVFSEKCVTSHFFCVRNGATPGIGVGGTGALHSS